jgi:thioesterase superfamily protein 4
MPASLAMASDTHTKKQASMIGTPSMLPKVPDYAPLPPHIQTELSQIPWAASLLSDPHIRPFISHNRNAKRQTGEDSLFAETLTSPSTLPVWQAFHRPPGASGQSSSPQLGEFLFIIRLGEGLAGHISTLHGGVISLLLDEALGYAAAYTPPVPERAIFTVKMEVEYKKPVGTPGWVLVRAWMDPAESPAAGGKKSRKRWGRGVIEDGEGGVYATGTALFVETRAKEERGEAKL